jgi:hypothetical protein
LFVAWTPDGQAAAIGDYDRTFVEALADPRVSGVLEGGGRVGLRMAVASGTSERSRAS